MQFTFLKLIVLCLVFNASLTLAQSRVVESGVARTLVSGGSDYGGCMIYIDQALDAGSGCPSKWLSLSCSGDFNQQQNAWQLLEQARLVLVTNKTAKIYYTEDYKHNGYCVVTRIDILR